MNETVYLNIDQFYFKHKESIKKINLKGNLIEYIF